MSAEEDWGLEVIPPFKLFAGDTSVYCKKKNVTKGFTILKIFCIICVINMVRFNYIAMFVMNIKIKKIFFLTENLYEEHTAKWHTSYTTKKSHCICWL